MLTELFIAAVFIFSAFFQVSFIHALPFPLQAIPLVFIIGTIIFHRTGVYLGSAWFIANGFLLSVFGFDPYVWWSYGAVAVLGIVFAKRLFTNRSVYALIGIGVSLYGLFAIFNIIPMLVTVLTGNGSPVFETLPLFIRHHLFGLLFLIIGLYLGFFLAKFLERISYAFLFTRKSL